MKSIVTLLLILQQTVSIFHVSLGSPAAFPNGHDS
jgi:hypothetical protein